MADECLPPKLEIHFLSEYMSGRDIEEIETSKKGVIEENTREIKRLLEQSGVTDYEDDVLTQLMEFAFTYGTEISRRAVAVMRHHGKSELSQEDIKVGVTQFRSLHSNDSYVERIANRINSQPIREPEQSYGVILESKTRAPDFQILSEKELRQQMNMENENVERIEEDSSESGEY